MLPNIHGYFVLFFSIVVISYAFYEVRKGKYKEPTTWSMFLIAITICWFISGGILISIFNYFFS